jgi:hypothetical protein
MLFINPPTFAILQTGAHENFRIHQFGPPVNQGMFEGYFAEMAE